MSSLSNDYLSAIGRLNDLHDGQSAARESAAINAQIPAPPDMTVGLPIEQQSTLAASGTLMTAEQQQTAASTGMLPGQIAP